MAAVAVPPRPFTPDYAVPPGGTLAEILAAKGFTQVEFAKRCDFTEKHISRIVNGEAGISCDAASRFETVTGVPRGFWNRLQTGYAQAKHRLEEKAEAERRTAEASAWIKELPFAELQSRGHIDPSVKSPAQQARAALAFFQVANIESWRDGWSSSMIAFRKSTAVASHPGRIAAWLRVAELEATDCAGNPYSAEALRSAIPELRSLTVSKPEEFLPEMFRICVSAGVSLSIVPEFKKCSVSGAVRWLGMRPLICLNLRGKSNDLFWFTFFHECGHVLNDRRGETYVDSGYDDDPLERSANRFAEDTLIPPNHAAEMRPWTRKADVERFARQIGIHPGIVVGRLQKERVLPYSHFNDLKVKLKWRSASE